MFTDRRQAGRLLAASLARYAPQRPIVVALPRGGVPLAAEIAASLDAPLDILAVRKLGAPGNPEFAIGALAEGGAPVVDGASARRVGVDRAALAALVAREAAELERRARSYRGDRPPLAVHGRVVIVVDDGLATGLTELAAVRALRALGALRIVVAVPVAVAPAIELLRAEADDVVCLTVPRELGSVGSWYQDFSPVPDEEVLAALHG